MQLNLKVDVYPGESGCYVSIVSVPGDHVVASAYGSDVCSATSAALLSLEEQIRDLRRQLKDTKLL